MSSLVPPPYPLLIYHRVNYLSEQIANQIFNAGADGAPPADGIEFDLRSCGQNIIVTHDPFTPGQLFSEFLSFLPKDRFYVVNIKCEGIEKKVISMLEEKGIQNFFLLDVGMPMIIRLAKEGERRFAVRISEFEAVETAECVKGMVEWIWLDCFSKLPLTQAVAEKLHSWGYKICLVSPELQGQMDKLDTYKEYLKSESISLDAICSKSYCIKKWIHQSPPTFLSFSFSQPTISSISSAESGIEFG